MRRQDIPQIHRIKGQIHKVSDLLTVVVHYDEEGDLVRRTTAMGELREAIISLAVEAER